MAPVDERGYLGGVFSPRSATAGNRLLRGALALVLALTAACGGGRRERPNVVLIVVDTLRADAILDPEGKYSTPAIDSLARDGVIFEQALAHAPMTLPSHTALFSSRPPVETRVVNNGQEVPGDLPLLSGWLGKYGYESRAVTSLATLSPLKAGTGLSRGFESYDIDYWNLDPAERVMPRISATLDSWDRQRRLFLFAHFCDPHEPYDSHADTGRQVHILLDGQELTTVSSENMTVLEDTLTLPPGKSELQLLSRTPFRVRFLKCLENGKPVELIRDEAFSKPGRRKSAVIDRKGSTPGECTLKLWVSDSLPKPIIRERYVAEVEHVDRYVGELLTELRDKGIYEDSLILFTSDHGEALGEHGAIGHVQNLTHDQIAVPLIIKPPKGSGPWDRLDATRLVRHVDLVPTILQITGVPALPGQKGQSLLSTPDEVPLHIAQTHKPEAKKDKLAFFDGHYKLIYTVDDDTFRMFDLREDPAENRDVYATRISERPDWPDKLKSLAEVAGKLTRGDEDLTDDLANQLRALGYGD